MAGKKGAAPRKPSIDNVNEAKRVLQELYDWKALGYENKEEVFDYVFLAGANRIISLARYGKKAGNGAKAPKRAPKKAARAKKPAVVSDGQKVAA